jgi:3alpha(or 20beta)-hydroxysteroid dehydrogenase
VTGSLDGRVVVVTGGARGQGREHVLLLAREGATVYALDVIEDAGMELEREATLQGLAVTFRVHDVADELDWTNLADHLASAHGAVHGLVNNAGVAAAAPLEEVTLGDFERIMRINVTGVFLGMKSMWKLLAVEGGSVVNTSSVYGLVSAPGYIAYTASKAAVLGMTRTASVEGAPRGIRVNALLPGAVATQMAAEEEKSYVRSSTPLGRGGDPRELAQIVRFLVSDESAFITGVDIVADGGFMAGGFTVGRD